MDIEDLHLPSGGAASSEVEIIPRGRQLGPKEPIVGDIPGTQTVYLKTQGCAHNSSDGEYMAGILSSYGYRITEKISDSPDLYLFNSCTVKGPSQDSFLHAVKSAKDSGKPVVVAGCVPQGQPNHPDLDGLSVIGVQQIHRVLEVVEQALKGNTVRLLSQKGKPSLDLPKIRCNPYIEVIPISTGCLNNCTYCKTKHARGDLGSYELEAIVERARHVVQEEGVLEVRLTSEDTGAYGRDIGTDIAELLEKVADTLPEGCMMKVGMTNPPYMMEHIKKVAKILNHPRVFSFLHIPVQSGSDSVLDAMKREYTAAQFSELCDVLKEEIPDISLATDIICGFPTETESDFDLTMDLMAKYRLPFINISQFYPRPGTPAARMKRIPTQVVKGRSRRLTELHNSFTDCFASLVGKTMRVWLCGEKSADGKFALGHTKSYVQVLLDPTEAPVAGQVDAFITEAQRWCVLGNIVKVVSVAPTAHAPVVLQGVVPDPDEDERFEQKILKEEQEEQESGCCGTGGSGESCGCKSDPVPISKPIPQYSSVPATMSSLSLQKSIFTSVIAVVLFFILAQHNLGPTVLGLLISVFLMAEKK